MARPSVAARNLSLTEELEKLEQSITLTLQGTSQLNTPGECSESADQSLVQKSTTTLAKRTES